MEYKTKCSIVQYLFNTGRGTWAEEVQALYEENHAKDKEFEAAEVELRKIHDELAKMHAVYVEATT